MGLRLLEATVDASPDPGLRPGGFRGWPAGVDHREVLGVDGLRRPPRKRLDQGRTPRQRDALLVDRIGGVVGPDVLGELQLLRRLRPRRIAHRYRLLPEGDPACAAKLVRTELQHHPLDDDASRRALRGVRAARAVRRRREHLLRYAALNSEANRGR